MKNPGMDAAAEKWGGAVWQQQRQLLSAVGLGSHTWPWRC